MEGGVSLLDLVAMEHGMFGYSSGRLPLNVFSMVGMERNEWSKGKEKKKEKEGKRAPLF